MSMSVNEINLQPENLSGTPEFVQKLLQKNFEDISNTEKYLLLEGHELTNSFFSSNGFKKPVMIKVKNGLDMKVPSERIHIRDICNKLGGNYILDVIDAGHQIVEKMTFETFVDHFENSRYRTLNVLSLELSRTILSDFIEPPKIVKELSVTQQLWPYEDDCYFEKPLVEKYCLMTMAGAYTDFHIDFGGSSVWYHVLKGKKIFYVIPPRKRYIKQYEQWMKSSINRTMFFPDLIADMKESGQSEVFRLVVNKGNTILLPAGWIHAVYTPEDSLVFGGNFIHLHSINMQIKIYKIERSLNTEQKFLFPYFQKLHWFIAYHLLKHLKGALDEGKTPQKSYLKGAIVLLSTLPKWLEDCLEMTETARADLLPVKGDFDMTKLEMLHNLSEVVEQIVCVKQEKKKGTGDSQAIKKIDGFKSSEEKKKKGTGDFQATKKIDGSKSSEVKHEAKKGAGDQIAFKKIQDLDQNSKLTENRHRSRSPIGRDRYKSQQDINRELRSEMDYGLAMSECKIVHSISGSIHEQGLYEPKIEPTMSRSHKNRDRTMFQIDQLISKSPLDHERSKFSQLDHSSESLRSPQDHDRSKFSQLDHSSESIRSPQDHDRSKFSQLDHSSESLPSPLDRDRSRSQHQIIGSRTFIDQYPHQQDSTNRSKSSSSDQKRKIEVNIPADKLTTPQKTLKNYENSGLIPRSQTIPTPYHDDKIELQSSSFKKPENKKQEVFFDFLSVNPRAVHHNT